MSKVTNNVLDTINVKSYNQYIRYNKCQKLQTINQKLCIRSNKCQQLQTIY